jgi:hypothetical protein
VVIAAVSIGLPQRDNGNGKDSNGLEYGKRTADSAVDSFWLEANKLRKKQKQEVKVH